MFLVIIAKWALDNIETVVKYDDIANYEQPEVAPSETIAAMTGKRGA